MEGVAAADHAADGVEIGNVHLVTIAIAVLGVRAVAVGTNDATAAAETAFAGYIGRGGGDADRVNRLCRID